MRFQAPPVDHDRLFKELLTTFFWDFLKLFYPHLPPQLNRRSLRFLDKEVFTDVTAGEKHEADLVAQISWRDTARQPAWFLIHIEHQSSKQAEFGRRMFQYYARLHEKHGAPVFPIVVFSYDSPLVAEPESYIVEIAGKRVLDFQFEVVQLNRLNWREFVNHENPVASALMAKMQIAPQDRVRVKIECLRLLTTLRLNPAKMQLISGFVDTYLRLNREETQNFSEELPRVVPQAQHEEAVMQIVTSWMLEGMEKGWLKGMEEGRHEGETALVLRQLQRRVGVLSAAQEKRVRRLKSERIEELGEALLDFSTPKDLNAWLRMQK